MGPPSSSRRGEGAVVVRSSNVGYAGGINRGVREAIPAEAILILNPDVRLHEKSIPPLLEALQEPDVGIVAPQIRSPQGALELSLRHEHTLLRALGLTRTGLAIFSGDVARPADYTCPRIVDWATRCRPPDVTEMLRRSGRLG